MRGNDRPTRYPELGYRHQGSGLWRIVDNSSGSEVGPQYRTKAELLADLDRYARYFGCEGAPRYVTEGGPENPYR